jgi:hypothetical protein
MKDLVESGWLLIAISTLNLAVLLPWGLAR